jgi:hypothetical protein
MEVAIMKFSCALILACSLAVSCGTRLLAAQDDESSEEETEERPKSITDITADSDRIDGLIRPVPGSEYG